MTSISLGSKLPMAQSSFSRSIESHGSMHSADTTCPGWRGQGTITSEDIGTQTESSFPLMSAAGSMNGSGKALLTDIKRRRDETIIDIGLETMKYNGGIRRRKKNLRTVI